MGEASKETERLLDPPGSSPSSTSFGSNTTVVASPSSPLTHRHKYHREPSTARQQTPLSQTRLSRSRDEDNNGLGISLLGNESHASVFEGPITRCSSAEPLISPTSASSTNNDGNTPFHPVQCGDQIGESLSRQLYPPTRTNSASGKSLTLNDAKPSECRSKGPLNAGRVSLARVTILTISVYSTIFSGLWLFIAIIELPYDKIAARERLPPRTANVVVTAISKTVEMSFVTVVVASIGQILSRRALVDQRSITLADISMRSWILQPGTIISQWNFVRHTAASPLGILAILAAFMAMLYTTASESLVAPSLRLQNPTPKVMLGNVSTSFANSAWIERRCTTPITPDEDKDSNIICIQLQNAGQAYHNYMQYLGAWVGDIVSKNRSSVLARRPFLWA